MALSGPSRRRRRALFLPRLLREEGEKPTHQGSAQEKAYDIVTRWSKLESDGHLKAKESSRDAEFINEIFGQALGYKIATTCPDDYHIEREFTIPGVGKADGAIGRFPLEPNGSPCAVIELKGAYVDLDRYRSQGRTPVQQLWDYLNALPDCPWGILSNFVTIRLYHRDKTPLAYEEFSLKEMRELSRFRQFYCLFQRHGLLEGSFGRPPIAESLLEESEEQQRTVGDKLYEEYRSNRHALIYHLHKREKRPLDVAIRITQKLLDRIIFIAFCEDRDLLRSKVIETAYQNVAPFDRARNPKWRNFVNLFAAVDKGHDSVGVQKGYNGGLFKHDPEVDDLELDDEWTGFFRNVGQYDFKDEINVDVLGHLFEKSITELEKMRVGGLFAADEDEPTETAMKKSAERKRFGVYYTPPDFTRFIVRATVGQLVAERFESLAGQHNVDPDAKNAEADDAALIAYWRACLEALRNLKVCDPACGSGAFLIAAYEAIEEFYIRIADHLEIHGCPNEADELRDECPNTILANNLYGVDVSLEAVEITQLALWIRSARRNRTLADLSGNVVCGNSLVDDSNVHERALNWHETFPEVFDRDPAGFDCIIGNPPWERVKLQEREFFAYPAPKIAGAVNAATRRKAIAALEHANPDLYARYLQAKSNAERVLSYARKSGRYPLTGKGDINYYTLFAELARTLVAPNGMVGLLTPSGIASDKSCQAFFNAMMDERRLHRFYDFENRKGIFADLHRSFKFCMLIFGGEERTTASCDFVFFAHAMTDLKEKDRHIELTPDDMALMNPNTRTCPIFRSRRDADLTRGIYKRIPILIDRNRKAGGNPWGVKFATMFHQTNDAEKFRTRDELEKKRFKLEGNHWRKGKTTYLPLYEAKMVQMYDHRAAGVVVDEENWMRQGQTTPSSLVAHQNPEFSVQPRWWVEEDNVVDPVQRSTPGWFTGFKDITSPTNERTMIAAAIPMAACTNHFVLVMTDVGPRPEMCLLANLNSFVFDYVVRQKIGGVTLNFFIVEQLPTLAPDTYADPCPWSKRKTLESWISDRVLKLTCTANDMLPLADAAGFKAGVHKWKPKERVEMMAELDAAYFLLYGVSREDAEYILSTFTGTRRRDESETGTFRTSELILARYDELADASS